MTSTATFKASGTAGPFIYIPMVAPGEEAVVAAEAGHDLHFAFFPAGTTSARSGSDLVFVVDGGGAVVVKDFFTIYGDSLPNLLLPDGTVVASETFFADSTFDLSTATDLFFFGNAANSGAWVYRDDAGPLLDGVFTLRAEAGSGTGTAGGTGAVPWGLDDAMGFHAGDMDCMPDGGGAPYGDIFGLNVNALAAAGFPLEGFLDMENDVLTLMTGGDGEVVTRTMDIHYVDDLRPGAGGGFQPSAAMGAGHAATSGDSDLREQIPGKMSIKTTVN